MGGGAGWENSDTPLCAVRPKAHVLFKLKVGTTRRTSAFRFTAWHQSACRRFPNYSKGKEQLLKALEHCRVSGIRLPRSPLPSNGNTISGYSACIVKAG